ncbi:MAG: peptide ABC transporter substrate-binding protein [Candidatus Harrisonbacteria bacterium]|nr:peptide ABC transporter substrate-binding protein [Candidatus Harrisonbacteria bacterium]
MWYKLRQLIKNLSKEERRVFSGAFAVFAAASALLIFSLFYQNTVPEPVEGGSYTEGIVGQPISLNPLITGDNDPDRDLVALLFASLFDLLEKYETDADQKTWTLILKPNLKWSDGKPLTSDDVLFTISVIQDPDSRSPFFPTWQGVFAERISEREIRLNLKNPYAFFLDNIKNLRIAPNHIFGNIPPQNFRLSDFNLRPISSGPYKFESFEKRRDGFIEKYTFATNEYSVVGEPYIQNFQIRFFASKNEAIKAFNLKAIDGIGNLDPSDLENVKINRTVFAIERPRYYAIFLNQSTAPQLKEKAVRSALAAATDKMKFVNDIFQNKAGVVNGPLPPNVGGYSEVIFEEEIFSIEKANELLDQAGWKINESGVREKMISGAPAQLSFEVIVPEAQFLIDTANILKEDWKKIGVEINPIILRPSEVISNAIKPRNYQMMIFGNTLNNNPDIFSFWHSSQRFDPGLNLALFNNKDVDTLLETLRQNLDPDSRNEELSKLQTLIHNQRPVVFLYSPHYLYISSKNLGGISAKSVAIPAERFINVQDWYLKTARVFK